MSHTINYGGDASVAADAVLKFLAEDEFDGVWFVEITTHDGDKHSGTVTAFRMDENVGGVVTVTPGDGLVPNTEAEPVEVRTDDIREVFIP